MTWWGPRGVDPSSAGEVRVGGAILANPFMTASGTAGHDVEFAGHLPMNRLGATVVKSLFWEPWPGNPAPRVHMARAGMVNAVGLQGPGASEWVATSLPRLEAADATVVCSIWGRTVEEYRRAATLIAAVGSRIAALEVNLSCPNLEGRSGIVAHDIDLVRDVIGAVRDVVSVPVWAKLSPNTDRLVEIAAAAGEKGADAVTLVNTVVALEIDPLSGAPSLGNGGGGLSGPAIHPIAVRAVSDVHSALPDLDIVGVGGVASGADAIEMFRAGAKAVQVGTASFVDPGAAWRIAREATRGLRRLGMTEWSELAPARG
ncbi:MAG: dihydroorotate dehydrogenase [Ilumatobacteraceae bacterium]